MRKLKKYFYHSDRREYYYEEGRGAKWILMSEGAEKLGLKSQELPLDENRVKLKLEQRNPIICIMGPGDFKE